MHSSFVIVPIASDSPNNTKLNYDGYLITKDIIHYYAKLAAGQNSLHTWPTKLYPHHTKSQKGLSIATPIDHSCTITHTHTHTHTGLQVLAITMKSQVTIIIVD